MLCELYLMVQFSGTKHIHTVVQISLSSVSQIFHFLNYILFSQLLPLWTIHLQYIQVVSLCLGLSIGTVHAQSCLTLCDPMDCSPPGSYVYGISQARILEGVAISYSRGSSQTRDQTNISWNSCTARQIFFFFSPHWATWEALNLHEKELFLRLYLMFELSLSLSNFPYPKENISFEEHTFYSVYINGVKLNWLKQIFAEIMSMRLW